MTPQPQPQSQPTFSSSADVEAEVTRISDSMPGTAANISKFQEQLIEKQAELDKLRKTSHANDKRYRELEAIWEKRQFEYEELSTRYRVTMGELENEKLAREQAVKTKDFTLLRIDKLRAEVVDLRTQLTEAQNVNLASEDEKVAEVTRWKKEAADEKVAKERAIKQKESSESTLEYIKDQMRDAQTQASDWKEQYERAAAELADLQKKTSGDIGAHKKMHYDRTNDILKKQLAHERIRNANLERLNGRHEDEIQRLRGMQKGYGTRGSSVPRSPRVGAGGPGSRAASPLLGNRDRVSNLRNG
jgi:chromosome segregation ATPase